MKISIMSKLFQAIHDEKENIISVTYFNMNQKLVSLLFGALIVIGQKCWKCQGNDFPSLLVANATLGFSFFK